MEKLFKKVESQKQDDIYLDSGTDQLKKSHIYFGYVFSDGQDPYFQSGDTSEIEVSIGGDDGIGAATFSQYDMNKLGFTSFNSNFAACPGFLLFRDGEWVFKAFPEHLISWITEDDLEQWSEDEKLDIDDVRENVFKYIEKNKTKMITALKKLNIKFEG